MTDRPRRAQDASLEPLVTLEVLRLAAGATTVVRTLSESYTGLLTHYKGRGQYCPQDDTCKNHQIEQVWKGYCCAEEWVEVEQAWIPRVLEISESLDQDMKEVYRRGQVWQITHKLKKPKDKRGKVKGVLWEQLHSHLLPQPFSMLTPLLLMYHVKAIKLDTDNPQPRRTKLAQSLGSPPRPPSREQFAAAPVSQEMRSDLKELIARTAQSDADRLPFAARNGHQ